MAPPALLDRFATPHRAGELLQSLNPLWGSRLGGAPRLAVLERITPTGVDAAVLTLRPGHGWSGHRPGQHVTLGVDVDGVRHRRCFSITSVPGSELVELAVQSHPGGFVSEHLVHAALPGDVVALDGPTGDFTLPDRPSPRMLFVTGGSGLTPVMGMLRHLAQTHRRDAALDVVVVHHVRTRAHLLFGDELEALGRDEPWLRVQIVETRDELGEPRTDRHLDASRLDEVCGDWRRRATWACGPDSLLDSLAALRADAGATSPLHVESFGGNPTTRPDALGTAADDTPPAGGQVTFSGGAGGGRHAQAPGDATLLEVAESAGLCPKFGCRSGICHTCTTELVEGTVVDLRDGRRHGAGGHVQLCVSAAASDVTLDL